MYLTSPNLYLNTTNNISVPATAVKANPDPSSNPVINSLIIATAVFLQNEHKALVAVGKVFFGKVFLGGIFCVEVFVEVFVERDKLTCIT